MSLTKQLQREQNSISAPLIRFKSHPSDFVPANSPLLSAIKSEHCKFINNVSKVEAMTSEGKKKFTTESRTGRNL